MQSMINLHLDSINGVSKANFFGDLSLYQKTPLYTS